MDLIHTLFEPAGEGPHPTIIALHGWGANALDLQGLAPYIAGGKFMVICPQGPLEVPIGAVSGYGWFPIRMGPSCARIKSMRPSIAPPNSSMQRSRGIRSIQRKLVMLGFSQGGVMAFRLAFRQPERFAALVGAVDVVPARVEGQHRQSRRPREAADAYPAWPRGRNDPARAREGVIGASA